MTLASRSHKCPKQTLTHVFNHATKHVQKGETCQRGGAWGRPLPPGRAAPLSIRCPAGCLKPQRYLHPHRCSPQPSRHQLLPEVLPRQSRRGGGSRGAGLAWHFAPIQCLLLHGFVLVTGNEVESFSYSSNDTMCHRHKTATHWLTNMLEVGQYTANHKHDRCHNHP